MGIKKGKTLCIFSSKGGVGKTTNIINLAGVAKQLDKKVLIIDFDLYSGGVATSLNVKVKKSVYNMGLDLINNNYTSIDDYAINITENIDVLASPIDPRESNKTTISMIERVIAETTFHYDLILIDTNHALNEINICLLGIVDNILLFVTNDPIDLKNTRSLTSIFEKTEMKNYKILLNNSRDPFKNYFSMYDIKHAIKHNIDYTLSNQLFLRDIENNQMKGKIISLKNDFPSKYPEDYQSLLTIITDAMDGEIDE